MWRMTRVPHVLPDCFEAEWREFHRFLHSLRDVPRRTRPVGMFREVGLSGETRLYVTPGGSAFADPTGRWIRCVAPTISHGLFFVAGDRASWDLVGVIERETSAMLRSSSPQPA